MKGRSLVGHHRWLDELEKVCKAKNNLIKKYCEIAEFDISQPLFKKAKLDKEAKYPNAKFEDIRKKISHNP